MQFVDPGQYRPQDLPAWPNPLRFIDCGAYTGDTLEDFVQQGYEFEAIAAFEPYPVNFLQLVQNARHYPNIVNLPLAVGSKTESMCLEEWNHAGRSSISSPRSGDKNIQCVRLDEVLPTFAPNLIKMDIEGGELEALQGAERMIARHRPGLAICIYHRPKHLWEIPFLIDSWNLDTVFISGNIIFTLRLFYMRIPIKTMRDNRFQSIFAGAAGGRAQTAEIPMCVWCRKNYFGI
jgi:FkbM family methyltransferase